MTASRRGPTLFLLLALSAALPAPPACAAPAPEISASEAAPDDKLLHFLAGLASGLAGGGLLCALAPEAQRRGGPGSVCAAGAAASLLAGAGKEALDALRPGTNRVEAADLLHTLVGGLAGGVLAEALVRSGRSTGLPPRWIGIGLAIGGGAAGLRIACGPPPH